MEYRDKKELEEVIEKVVRRNKPKGVLAEYLDEVPDSVFFFGGLCFNSIMYNIWNNHLLKMKMSLFTSDERSSYGRSPTIGSYTKSSVV